MSLPPLERWLVKAMKLPPNGSLPSPGDLAAWRLERIRAVVGQAREKSPFYRMLLPDIGPDSIKTLDDFEKLPKTTADDLRRSPDDFLCVSRDEVARVVTLNSSGTTGSPKRIFHTDEDLERTIEFFRHGMENIAAPGRAVVILLPGDKSGGVGRLLTESLRRMGAYGVPLGPLEDADKVIDCILEERASCIVGSPAHLNVLASAWSERSLPRNVVSSVLVCWDSIPQAVVHNVARNMGAEVFSHWGMIETGLGGAVDCFGGSGMHLREAEIYMEITDPDSGRRVSDGEWGEMTVTTLSRMGMPLIRYRTGDRGRIIPGDCNCGSLLRRLDRRISRMGSRIALVHGGEFGLDDLNEALYALPGLSDFKAEYEPRGRSILRIEAVTGLERGSTVDEMRLALLGVEPIGRAVGAKKLDLDLKLSSGRGPALPGFDKRRIRITAKRNVGT